jgi:hypothetical protein
MAQNAVLVPCSLQGLPQVIAALDGMHTLIRKPANSGDSYINRKNYPSLNPSAACNADGVFVDVFVGFGILAV